MSFCPGSGQAFPSSPLILMRPAHSTAAAPPAPVRPSPAGRGTSPMIIPNHSRTEQVLASTSTSVSPQTHAAPYSASLAARLLAISAAKLARSASSSSNAPTSASSPCASHIPPPPSASAAALDRSSSAATTTTTIQLKHRILIARALAWAGRVTSGMTDSQSVDSILVGGRLNQAKQELEWSDQSDSDSGASEHDSEDDSWLLSNSDSDSDECSDSDLSDMDDVEDSVLQHRQQPAPPPNWPAHVQATAQEQYWLPSPPPSPPTFKRCEATGHVLLSPTCVGLGASANHRCSVGR